MSVELETIEEENGDIEIPEFRIKDANSTRTLFDTMFLADKEASLKRAAYQRMFDGEDPYSQAELTKAGQGFRCNVNFGEAEDVLASAVASYVDMLQSVEVMFSGRTTFGETESEKDQYSQTISKEISDMIRRWNLFLQRYLLKATYFIGQGVGFAAFRDHLDWKYTIRNQGEFLVPRDADASEDEVEVAFFREKFTATQLYRIIRNEKAAKAMGWNPDVVKQAIMKSAKTSSSMQSHTLSWEEWATKMKGDDLTVGASCNDIELIFCLTREFDGTVTQSVITREATINEFLFRRPKQYQEMSQAFVSFIYGVGTGGKYHGIRSLGSRIFAPVQVNNRMYCQHIDGSMLASSLHLQPENESAMGKNLVSFRGPFTYIHPQANVIEKGIPNFAQNTLPVIRQMSDLIRSKSGGYTSDRALPDDGREMSKGEAEARISNSVGMTITNTILFLTQEEKLLREQVRRIINPNYVESMPGGKEVKKLHEKLESLGIPLEALYAFDPDSVVVTTPVGAGSALARDGALRNAAEMAPGFDDIGRRKLLRMRTANALGSWTMANELVPPDEKPRLSEGAKFALIENSILMRGEAFPIQSEDFHRTHLEVHVQKIIEVIQMVEQGAMPMEEGVTGLLALHGHSVEHLQYLSSDPIAEADAAQFRQILQQAGEPINNWMKEIQANQEEQATAVAAGGGQPNPEMAKHQFELQRKSELLQMDLQNMASRAALDQQIAISKANTEAQIMDIKAAANLSIQSPRRNR